MHVMCTALKMCTAHNTITVPYNVLHVSSTHSTSQNATPNSMVWYAHISMWQIVSAKCFCKME